jgi:hypothetical protein
MTLESKRNSPELPLIWMDDELSEVQALGKLLMRERSEVRLTYAKSIDAAWELYESRQYRGIIVDCKMDPYDKSENGAAFLVKLNRRDKSFPTFVYSAYLHDPLYSEYVVQSYALRIESKTQKVSRPVTRHPFFSAVIDETERLSALSNFRPENIPFDEFLRAPERYVADTSVHWDKHGHWLTKEMQIRQVTWLVVCGEDIVESSRDLAEFPTEERLRAIGYDTNLVPFAYTATLPPEEQVGDVRTGSPWNSTIHSGDWYPTIRVALSGQTILGDFDTGAVRSFASDQIVRKSIFDSVRRSDVPHLGKDFRFFTKSVPATMVDDQGGEQTRSLTLGVVENWEESPFTAVNPERRVLFGRDVLRSFNLNVTLDTENRTTTVKLKPKA